MIQIIGQSKTAHQVYVQRETFDVVSQLLISDFFKHPLNFNPHFLYEQFCLDFPKFEKGKQICFGEVMSELIDIDSKIAKIFNFQTLNVVKCNCKSGGVRVDIIKSNFVKTSLPVQKSCNLAQIIHKINEHEWRCDEKECYEISQSSSFEYMIDLPQNLLIVLDRFQRGGEKTIRADTGVSFAEELVLQTLLGTGTYRLTGIVCNRGQSVYNCKNIFLEQYFFKNTKK